MDVGLLSHVGVTAKALLFRLKIRVVWNGVERTGYAKTTIATALTGKGNVIYYRIIRQQEFPIR